MQTFRSVLSALVVAVAVGGCAGAKSLGEAVGIIPETNEDALSVANAPLSLPPDYNLRPPQPGSGKATARAATVRGRQAVFGDKRAVAEPATITEGARSPGENALLRRASGNQAVESNIRGIVDQETQSTGEAEKAFSDKLLKWRNAPRPAGPAQANAEEESDGQTQTRPVDDDNVPVIKKKGEIF